MAQNLVTHRGTTIHMPTKLQQFLISSFSVILSTQIYEWMPVKYSISCFAVLLARGLTDVSVH